MSSRKKNAWRRFWCAVRKLYCLHDYDKTTRDGRCPKCQRKVDGDCWVG